MAQKLVDEWRETLTAQIGHCNFEEIVQQYQHNLEQGYVLYGLIAQKNNEIDRLEDEIKFVTFYCFCFIIFESKFQIIVLI